jgi:hypothetical protein
MICNTCTRPIEETIVMIQRGPEEYYCAECDPRPPGKPFTILVYGEEESNVSMP